MPPLDRAQLVRELRALRKGAGARSADAMGDCPTIVAAYGHGDPVRAGEAFLHALQRLGDDREYRAYRNALGIGLSNPGTLTKRRTNFAHLEFVSTKTVESWENKAVERIADSLRDLHRDWDVEYELHDLYVFDGSIIGYERTKVINGEGESQYAASVKERQVENFDDAAPSFPFFWWTAQLIDTAPQRFRVNFHGRRPDLVLIQLYKDDVLASMQVEPLYERALSGVAAVLEPEPGQRYDVWTVETATFKPPTAGFVFLLHWVGATTQGSRYGLMQPAGDPWQPPLF